VLWKSLLIGFICGTAVSIGNYYYLQWTMKKNKDRSSKEAINAVISCYINRFFYKFPDTFLGFLFRSRGMDVGWGWTGISSHEKCLYCK
jgi:hypothetical protein